MWKISIWTHIATKKAEYFFIDLRSNRLLCQCHSRGVCRMLCMRKWLKKNWKRERINCAVDAIMLHYEWNCIVVERGRKTERISHGSSHFHFFCTFTNWIEYFLNFAPFQFRFFLRVSFHTHSFALQRHRANLFCLVAYMHVGSGREKKDRRLF